ncbi:putative 50 kda protein in type i retrotransposable element r1dm [Lasius niger]|uniref:Putative 50 kDa protein in type i retrotransposable element r1dm n=1 Tax=Lasius niger TaxID=67767 RepID=A0A0J7K1H4_LASNI|nr:putative 50 kda protein in type i retrotransposable element r1dm [Lasius niger]
MRKAVSEVLDEKLDERDSRGSSWVSDGRIAGPSVEHPASYASVAGSSRAEVHVSGGPTVELAGTTSFIVVPDDKHAVKYASSQATRETLSKVFKPSDCGLKVNRISYTRNNGVRIEAFSPDMDKIKAHPGLATAGLMVQENLKIKPRLIVHGIPTDMSADEVSEELIAQNLSCDLGKDLKVIYVFPPKQDRRSTSCILEVTPAIRSVLLESGRIFLRYAVCAVADHIRILQCFKCLKFGHIAKNCKSKSSCGHCAGDHEMKNCEAKGQLPSCINCKQHHVFSGNTAHSATDAKKCPILGRKIKDKIANTNYG